MTQPNTNSSGDWPKRVAIFLHGEKETNWSLGEDIGLSDEAIKENFKYALYEVELWVDVYEDGNIKIITVDGRKLADE